MAEQTLLVGKIVSRRDSNDNKGPTMVHQPVTAAPGSAVILSRAKNLEV
jgi:hypothetical protein